MKKIVIWLFSTALILSACSSAEGIEVSESWARMGESGGNSAVYFVIQNHNSAADKLVGASTDIAGATEIHESKMDGDVMTMNHMDTVLLKPSTQVEFKPGGLHIMLINLKQDLKMGDEVVVTLHFENSPDLTITAPVKDADGMNMN